MNADAVAPYAPVLIKLLQGIVYHDDAAHWSLLLQHQAAIMEYVGRIGLHLYVDEGEGFAYVQQPVQEDDGQTRPLPRLTRRDRLSYGATLLLVLLREALLQFDAGGEQSDRLVLPIEHLRDMQRPFFPERNDETKLLRTLDANVARVEDLGFLHRLSGDEERYEVRRIITAKISADTLAEIKTKLQNYAESVV